MLSFWREQGAENLSAQRPVAAGRADSEGLEDAQGQHYLTVAVQSKNVRRSTMLVGILFCLGLVFLWYMIKKSAPQPASASPADMEETQIEVSIARLTGVSSEMFSGMDQIVKKFYEFSDVLQVQVSELVKNPFRLEAFLTNLAAEVDAEEQDLSTDANMIKRQKMIQQSKDMKLLSIMQSDSKCLGQIA